MTPFIYVVFHIIEKTYMIKRVKLEILKLHKLKGGAIMSSINSQNNNTCPNNNSIKSSKNNSSKKSKNRKPKDITFIK